MDLNAEAVIYFEAEQGRTDNWGWTNGHPGLDEVGFAQAIQDAFKAGFSRLGAYLNDLEAQARDAKARQ